MTPLRITASTLVNACGVGWREMGAALRQHRSGLRANDFAPAAELVTAIGRVTALDACGRDAGGSEAGGSDAGGPVRAGGAAGAGGAVRAVGRMEALLRLTLDQDGFATAVARTRARVGAQRIGVFIGTSTSGIFATEMAVRDAARSGVPASFPPGFYADCHQMFAPARAVRTMLRLDGVVQSVSTACSSSAKVFGAAARAMAAGLCDAAVVGGADTLALSTLHGFHALELLSAKPCRPWDAARDGISIGEAAGFALLEREGDAAVVVSGFGESADAFHISTPHPEGAGAALAMARALARAGLAGEKVDYVNLHGTGTRANDAAEDHAVCSALPHRPPVSSTKGWTGHALGAAGITEALLTAWVVEHGWVPRTLGCTTIDPALRANVVTESFPQPVVHALTNSFGFGGSNCTLLLSRAP